MRFSGSTRISAFVWLYLLTSSTTRRNSPSDIRPSTSAPEMWSEIVFSLLSARILISSCFLALTARRRPTNFPVAPRTPQASAAISRPKTTGAAIIVDRRPTPPIPIPMPAGSNAVSTPSRALTPRRYFLCSFFRLSLSSSRCFFSCEISCSL